MVQCHDKRPGGLMKGKASLRSNIVVVKEIYMKVNRDEKVGKCSGSLLPSTTRKTMTTTSTYFFVLTHARAHARLCLKPIRRESHNFFFSEDRRSRRQTKMVVNGDRTRGLWLASQCLAY